MLVGNVISVAGLSTRFTSGATGLYAQFLASLLECWKSFLGPSGKVDVDGSSHASPSVVVTGKIASEFWESVLHEVFNSNTLVLGDSRGQTESLDGSSNTNSDRVNWDIRANVSLDFFNVHVGNMFEASGKTMVFADEWVKDISKVKVGVFVTSIDTTMLVIEFYCNSDGLCQSESRGLCDDSGKFVPFLFGDVLGDQGVLRFDFWEFCHCFVLFVLGRTILLKAER